MADWDTFASEYDRIFLESRIYRKTIDTIVDLVGDGESRVLDLGCGTGNVTASLIARRPEARVLAVDPSEGMREVASRRFTDAVSVSVAPGDALSIPADDCDFDYVMSNIALHHIPPENRYDCTKEVARVLKPGGEFIYADFFCDVEGGPGDAAWYKNIIESHTAYAMDCIDCGANEMMILMFKSLPATLQADGEHLTTEQTWIAQLQRAGFHDFKVISIPPEATCTRILHTLKKEI